MKIDHNPFKMNSSFTEPMYLLINMVNVKEGLDFLTPPEMVEVDPKPIPILIQDEEHI